MRNQLYYDGKALSDFGVYVSGDGVFGVPEKDYTITEVPGRNGDIYSFNNRYKNITVSYHAFIIGKDRISGNAREDFALRMQGLRAWLSHSDKYCRISDTYHPDQFRMGIHSEQMDIYQKLLTSASRRGSLLPERSRRYLRSRSRSTTRTSSTHSRTSAYMDTASCMLESMGSR